jgi:hypothetical protein
MKQPVAGNSEKMAAIITRVVRTFGACPWLYFRTSQGWGRFISLTILLKSLCDAAHKIVSWHFSFRSD